MSQTIDNQIVTMTFKNEDFEKNVNVTLNSLKKLKQSLDTTESVNSLKGLEKAANNISFDGLYNNVDGISQRFSNLGIVGMTIIQNLTNSVLNFSAAIAKSLTIDQLLQGFEEYQLKMTTEQTLIASTGEEMNTVSEYLNRLNKYADQTIYKFSDMTANIGKFTNAGVSLETATKAMQGIANWAAISGAKTDEMARSMYNLAQSIAGGYVQYIDWKSVTWANMATKSVKEHIVEVAKVLGTLDETAGQTSESLNALFSGGKDTGLGTKWLTTDVLMTALEHYSTDIRNLTEAEKEEYEVKLRTAGFNEEQIKAFEELGIKANDAATKVKTFSELMDTTKEAIGTGWADTFEILFGNFEEARNLWTSINDVLQGIIQKSTEARNNLLSGWKDKGGRDELIKALGNIWNFISKIASTIGTAFREIFPPMTVNKLLDITKNFERLTESLKMSDKTVNNLKNTFKGLFAIFDIIFQVLQVIIIPIKQILSFLPAFGGGVLNITGNLGDLIVSLDNFIKNSKIFVKAGEAIAYVIKNIGQVIGWIIEKIGDLFESLAKFSHRNKDVQNSVTDTNKHLVNMQNAMSTTQTVAEKMANGISNAFRKIGESQFAKGLAKFLTGIGHTFLVIADALGVALDKIGESISKLSVSDIMSAGFIATMIANIKTIFKPFKDIGELFDDLTDDLHIFTKGIQGMFNAWAANIRTDAAKQMAEAILMIAGAMLILSTIDGDKLAATLGVVSTLLAELFAGLKLLMGNQSSGIKGGITKILDAAAFKFIADGFIKISAAILILAAALRVLGSMPIKDMVKGIGGIEILLWSLVGVLVVLDKMSIQKSPASVGKLLVMAIVLSILVNQIKKLASIDAVSMLKGLLGIEAILWTFVAILLVIQNIKTSTASVSKLVGIVLMVTMLCMDISALAKIDGKKLTGSIVAIEVMLWSLVGVLAVLGKMNNTKTSTAKVSKLIGLVSALTLLTIDLRAIAKLDTPALIRGLVGIETLMWSLVGILAVLNRVPNGKGSITKVTNLMFIAEAALIMTMAMKPIAKLDTASIIRGLVGMEAMMWSLVGVLAVLNKIQNGGKSTLSLIAMCAALDMLALAMGGLAIQFLVWAIVPWEAIIKGLTAFGAALTGLLIVSKIAESVKVGITIITLALMGIISATALVILALSKLADSLSKFTAQSALGAMAFASSLTFIGKAIGGLIPSILAGFAQGLLDFLKTIADGAAALTESLVKIGMAILDAIRQLVPAIIETLLTIVDEALKSLAKHIGSIVDSILEIIIKIIRAITKRIPELVTSIAEFITTLVNSVIGVLKDVDPTMFIKTLAVMGMIASIVVVANTIKSMVPGALIGVAGIALVMAEIAGIIGLFGLLNQIPGFNWLVNEGGKLLEAIGSAIGGFIGGIVGGIARGIINNVSEALPNLATGLSEFMDRLRPFISGVSALDDRVLDNIKTMVAIIYILSAVDLMNAITSFLTNGDGMNSFIKFGDGLVKFTGYLKAFAKQIEDLDDATLQRIKIASQAIGWLAKASSEIPNTGGLAAFFAGENSISEWGPELPKLGKGLTSFAKSVSDLSDEDFEKIKKASEAVTVLAKACDEIPNEGASVAAFFVGDNAAGTWAPELPKLGAGLAKFSSHISGMNADDFKKIAWASNAIKVLAKACDEIPNEGASVAAFFVGDNAAGKWAPELSKLGQHFRKFADNVKPLGKEDFEKIHQSAVSIYKLAKVCHEIPDGGNGLFGLFGAGKMTKAGVDLVGFGKEFKSYANTIKDVDFSPVAKSFNEFKDFVTSVNTLSEAFNGESLSTTIGDYLTSFSEGMESIITTVEDLGGKDIDYYNLFRRPINAIFGDLEDAINSYPKAFELFSDPNAFSSFGSALKNIVEGLTKYTESANDIDLANVDFYNNFRRPLNSIFDCLDHIVTKFPNAIDLFKNNNGLSGFGRTLSTLAQGLKDYIDVANDIDFSKIDFYNNFRRPLNSIFDCMNNIVTNYPDAIELFKNGVNLNGFGDTLSALGSGISDYIDHVSGLNLKEYDFYNNFRKPLTSIFTAINACIVNEPEAVELFKDSSAFSSFNTAMSNIALGLKTYCDNMEGVNTENITNSYLKLKNLINAFSNVDVENPLIKDDMSQFGTNMANIADGFSKFTALGDDLPSKEDFENIINYLKDLVDVFAGITTENNDTIATFLSNMKSIGEMSLAEMMSPLIDSYDTANNAITSLLRNISDSVENNKEIYMVTALSTAVHDMLAVIDNDGHLANIKTHTNNLLKAMYYTLTSESTKKWFNYAGSEIVGHTIAGISNSISKAYDIGNSVVDGYVNGIVDNLNKASNAAYKLSDATIKALKDALDIHSPSRVMEKISEQSMKGYLLPFGKFSDKAYAASEEVANSTIQPLEDSMTYLQRVIDDNLDLSPVIRPTLDLSALKSNANFVNELFKKNPELEYGSEFQNGGNIAPGARNNGSTINFTQNNYSPKALSRIDIYRQTRNQLSQAKGVL